MEDGLAHYNYERYKEHSRGLNPCCSGQWSRTDKKISDRKEQKSLNPYCSGQWSRTAILVLIALLLVVLILIVVDNGLVRSNFWLLHEEGQGS